MQTESNKPSKSKKPKYTMTDEQSHTEVVNVGSSTDYTAIIRESRRLFTANMELEEMNREHIARVGMLEKKLAEVMAELDARKAAMARLGM
jgi:hypothetical protein